MSSLNVRLTDEFKRQNTRPHDRRDEQRNIPQAIQVVPHQQQVQQQEMQQQFENCT